MRNVYAYWHGRGGLGSTTNFGDDLTPFLCRALSGREVSFRDARKPGAGCDLIGVGSLLQWVSREHDGHIWGTGFIKDDVPNPLFPRAQVTAVRGVKTAQKLGVDPKKIALGDPGLLAHVLKCDGVEKTHRVGLIPHLIHHKHRIVQRLTKKQGIHFINIRRLAPQVVIEAQRCDFIISSSLHGLVLADSLGIPNRWAWLANGKGIIGGRFKFDDYYSAFGIHRDPITLEMGDTYKTIIKKIGYYERPGLQEIKEKLVESFSIISRSCRD